MNKHETGRVEISMPCLPHYTRCSARPHNAYKDYDILFFQPSQTSCHGAADCLVPFYLFVLDLSTSSFATCASECAMRLDKLARSVDACLDHKLSGTALGRTQLLNTRIEDCLYPLIDELEYTCLLRDTKAHVRESIIANTVGRDSCYFIGGVGRTEQSTMGYLYPLIDALSTHYRRQANIDRLFLEMTIYIQLIDDFVDLLDDLNNMVRTPLTCHVGPSSGRFHAGKLNPVVFCNIYKLVVCKMDKLRISIQSDLISHYGKSPDCEFFTQWDTFDLAVQTLHCKCDFAAEEQKDFLTRFAKLVPPLFAYIS